MSTLLQGLALLALLLGVQGCLRLEGPPPTTEDGEPCEVDSQCQSTSACEYDSAVSDYVCRVRGGCTTHTQCAGDQACVFGSCRLAECVQNGTCAGYACNQTLRQCYDSCAGDSQCETGYVCRDGECLSGTCTAATAARVCDGTACYAGVCESAFDCDAYGCAAGYTCDSYDCVRVCTSDAQCERYTCNATFSECRERCSLESDCQPGYVCKDSFCQVDSP